MQWSKSFRFSMLGPILALQQALPEIPRKRLEETWPRQREKFIEAVTDAQELAEWAQSLPPSDERRRVIVALCAAERALLRFGVPLEWTPDSAVAYVQRREVQDDLVHARRLIQDAEIDFAALVRPVKSTRKKAATWRVIQRRMEEHCKRNPWPGVNAFAVMLKCSSWTIRKARKASPDLLKAASGVNQPPTSVKARARVNDVVLDNTVNKSSDAAPAGVDEAEPGEPNPELIERLVKKLPPSQQADARERLRTMDPARLEELAITMAENPDKGTRLGRERKK